MNFETIKFESHLNAEKAYKKVERLLESDAIHEKDFTDIYGQEKIEKDIKDVEDLESEFSKRESEPAKEAHTAASVLEYIIYQQGEVNEWFGEGAITVKTSKTDDFKNGVDLVVEFENEKGKYLGLAVDISFGKELSKKVGRIKNEIDRSELGKVEYYHSPHSEKKALLNLPRVVLAFDSKRTVELIQMWLDGENEKLGDHPAQFQIVVEILLQLKKYQQYAREIKGNEEIANIYENVINTVKKIKEEKKKIFTREQGEYLDGGYDHLDSALSVFEHEINKNKKVESDEEIRERLYKKFPHLKKKAPK